jgi:hypothetical protein
MLQLLWSVSTYQDPFTFLQSAAGVSKQTGNKLEKEEQKADDGDGVQGFTSHLNQLVMDTFAG